MAAAGVYPFWDFPRRSRPGYTLGDGAELGRGGGNHMAVEVERARRLFTVAEYHRMGEAGILAPGERVELIRGEIVEMSPIGPRHAAFVDNLNQLLVLRLAGRTRVSVQNPVELSEHSEPQPDLKLLRRRALPYKAAAAQAEDTLLVIEVAETSLAYDRATKLRLYAESGVPEYWVVDCASERVEVYRHPDADGYRDAAVIGPGGTVSPETFPDVALSLAEIFA